MQGPHLPLNVFILANRKDTDVRTILLTLLFTFEKLILISEQWWCNCQEQDLCNGSWTFVKDSLYEHLYKVNMGMPDRSFVTVCSAVDL
jgi:hypothetical protein